MPFSMGDYPQVVIVRGKVHIGGGWALSGKDRRTVMVYDDAWRTLPPYEYTRFSMAVINDQLVLVGGLDVTTHKSIAMLRVWSEQSQTWTDPFPPMPTARRSPSVVTHDNRWLVVVGGEIEDAVTDVEILDTTLGQWYHGAPIPRPCFCASAATVGNTCYVLGGFTSDGSSSKKVFSMRIDELISRAVLQPASATASPTQSISPLETLPPTPPTLSMSPWKNLPDTPLSPSVWKTLPHTPLSQSTALAFNGALLAVGGNEEWRMSKSIHVYQPSSKKWVKVGELLTERATCACTVLPSHEIFVAGGTTSTNTYGSIIGSITGSTTQTVEVATIQ